MMSLVRATFDSIDLAELASLRLKTELKTVRHVDFATEASAKIAAESHLADYFQVPVAYNEYDPYSLSRNYEPEIRSTTRVTVHLDGSEAKTCMSLLRSIGGTKVALVSD